MMLAGLSLLECAAYLALTTHAEVSSLEQHTNNSTNAGPFLADLRSQMHTYTYPPHPQIMERKRQKMREEFHRNMIKPLSNIRVLQASCHAAWNAASGTKCQSQVGSCTQEL